MPCYSQPPPTNIDKESIAVRTYINEFHTELGFDPYEVDDYFSKYVNSLDEDTATLCHYCSEFGSDDRSLELQIWWRDHQEWDNQRKLYDKPKLRVRNKGEYIARLYFSDILYIDIAIDEDSDIIVTIPELRAEDATWVRNTTHNVVRTLKQYHSQRIMYKNK